MTIYVPGTEEQDPKRVIMSLQQVADRLETAESDKVTGPSSATDNALSRFDGATGKIVQNSEITLGDTDGKLTRSAGISISGTNTNDSAASGYVGEYIESDIQTGSAVALTSTIVANVTSISLTAGDWDVRASVTFKPGATTNVTLSYFSISQTSATQDATTGGAYNVYRFPGGNVPVADYTIGPVGPIRKKLSGTTTIYLVVQSTFTISTMSAYGIISARRVR